jgi:hypothetical protein
MSFDIEVIFKQTFDDYRISRSVIGSSLAATTSLTIKLLVGGLRSSGRRLITYAVPDLILKAKSIVIFQPKRCCRAIDYVVINLCSGLKEADIGHVPSQPFVTEIAIVSPPKVIN